MDYKIHDRGHKHIFGEAGIAETARFVRQALE
jgi:hypothetical protein